MSSMVMTEMIQFTETKEMTQSMEETEMMSL